MMSQLYGNNDACHEIYDAVSSHDPHYEEIMQRYRITTSPYYLGSYWKEWAQEHSKHAVISLVQRLMGFWCWCETYTLRFAVCWGDVFGEQTSIDDSDYYHFNEERLQRAAEGLYDNRQVAMNNLLTCPQLAVRGAAVGMDAEDVLFTLLDSNLTVPQAFRLAERVAHAKELKQDDVDALHDCGLPQDLLEGMLSRTYVPSRRVAVAAILQTMNLIQANK